MIRREVSDGRYEMTYDVARQVVEGWRDYMRDSGEFGGRRYVAVVVGGRVVGRFGLGDGVGNGFRL